MQRVVSLRPLKLSLVSVRVDVPSPGHGCAEHLNVVRPKLLHDSIGVLLCFFFKGPGPPGDLPSSPPRRSSVLQSGTPTACPACTSDVAVESVTGDDQLAPPLVDAAPAIV